MPKEQFLFFLLSLSIILNPSLPTAFFFQNFLFNSKTGGGFAFRFAIVWWCGHSWAGNPIHIIILLSISIIIHSIPHLHKHSVYMHYSYIHVIIPPHIEYHSILYLIILKIHFIFIDPKY